MATKHARLHSFALFAALTAAVTSTQTGADFTDARLASWKSGFLMVNLHTLVVNDTDETYSFQLQGRQTAAAAYTNLHAALLVGGSAVVGAVAAVAGLLVINVTRFYKRMRLVVTIGGTTPSSLYSVTAVANEFTYLPDSGVVITS